MNEARYKMYWMYALDMHNHHIEGNVRHVINPTSKKRMEMISQKLLDRQMSRLKIGDSKHTNCECSRKCMQRCPCVMKNKKCGDDCHNTKIRRKDACTNI